MCLAGALGCDLQRDMLHMQAVQAKLHCAVAKPAARCTVLLPALDSGCCHVCLVLAVHHDVRQGHNSRVHMPVVSGCVPQVPVAATR